MADLRKARAAAWETRRERYGARGHSGSYQRGKATKYERSESPVVRGAINLVFDLLNEGTLSEGQVAKALKLDRVGVRRMADQRAEEKRNG